MRKRALSVLISLVAGLGAVPAGAAEQPWYLAPSLSHVIADDDRAADNGWGGSLALGRQINEAWNLEFSVLGDSLDLDGRPGDWRHWGVALDGLYFLGREKAFAPYLVLGAGYLHSRIPGDSDGGPMVAAGVGFQRQLADSMSLRGDLRYRWSQADLATVADDAFGDWVVSVGLNIALDRKPTARPAAGAPAAPAQVAAPAAVPAAEPVAAPAVPAPIEAVRPGDGDRDGVPDGSDRCPDTPAGVTVDAQGCEPDSDRDGVVDRLDRCPDTPAGAAVDAQGCELDSDRDGVVDRLDRCPDTPAGAAVDAQGCEPDSDRDGVVDRLDRCPDTPAGTAVDAQGCEPDSDRDGVVDRRDRCPDTPPGTAVDGMGCTPPAEIAALESEPARQLVQAGDGDVVVLLKGVNFAFDSAVLRPDAVAILDQAVSVLKYRSDIVKVEIAGHTCSIGTEKYNQGLSERRAKSVYRYFVAKGLAGERFLAKGYGELKPAFSNDTRAGRASNRRVELHIVTD